MSKEKFYLCLDVGGTKILGVVIDENNKIVFEEKIKTGAESGSQRAEDNIFEVIDNLFHYATNNGTAISIAIGVPGIINHDTGEIVFSPNIYWKNYPLKSKVFDRYKIPCFVGNDVNLGLLGEWKYGQLEKFKNCVGIFVGTGIGGGIIINNKLYAGNSHWAGEIGHVIIEQDGPVCGCGNKGCLEAFAGKKGITAYIKQQIDMGRKTLLSHSIKEEKLIRGKALKDALKENDTVAIEVIERVAKNLARGAGTFINIFNPEVVIFGGGIIEATSKFIMPMIIENIPQYCIKEILINTKIVKAEMGDYSVVWGARAFGEEHLNEEGK